MVRPGAGEDQGAGDDQGGVLRLRAGQRLPAHHQRPGVAPDLDAVGHRDDHGDVVHGDGGRGAHQGLRHEHEGHVADPGDAGQVLGRGHGGEVEQGDVGDLAREASVGHGHALPASRSRRPVRTSPKPAACRSRHP
jgi:hypothetical protein